MTSAAAPDQISKAEVIRVISDLYGEAPSGSFDNGGTEDGWRMACAAIEKAVKAATTTIAAVTDHTNAEVAHFEVVEAYLRDLLAKPSSLSDDEKTLIAGNIRGFYATAFPFDGDTNSLLMDAETAIEEYSCRTPVSHIASEMETLAARVRAYRLSEKRKQSSVKPLSTYPQDKDALITLAKRVEKNCDDDDAVKLADWVRAILEDEAVGDAQ